MKEHRPKPMPEAGGNESSVSESKDQQASEPKARRVFVFKLRVKLEGLGGLSFTQLVVNKTH